jgi:ornithine cyclodeaminase/alanine dehydrogenase-like protein (mu-crystallin family)
MTDSLPYFDEAQVGHVLTYEDLLPALRRALIEFSARRVVQPVRSVLAVEAYSGWFAVMPAVFGDIMGAKLVTFYPGNSAEGKHTHMAVIQLFRADTGEPLAAMDGRLITEMRTAAVSALAVDQLAPPNASILAIFGSGVQAHSHYKALSLVRRFQEVRVWSRSESNARKFAAEIGGLATSAEKAAQGADVIVTVTSSATPVLFGKWLKHDALVCAVGAVTPDRRELDQEAMRGNVIVESREASLREPGDILMAGAEVTFELGQLLSGKTLPNRTRPTVFKSVGIAIEDIAAAKLVYDKITALE